MNQSFQDLPDNTMVLIAGAGPAGATASLFLCKSKIPHIIVDRALFPRDKICGDALSGKVLDILDKLNPDYRSELGQDAQNFLGSHGVRFIAPSGKSVDIPFQKNSPAGSRAPGFISTRKHFDDFLIRKINPEFGTLIQETTVKIISGEQQGILAELEQNGKRKRIEVSVLIAAGGDRSPETLPGIKQGIPRRHYSAGIRAYMQGVEGFHQQNFIELHFLNDLLPGYFWIFPMTGGKANIGIGMLSSTVASRKINLRKMLMEIIREHPSMKHRFRNAEFADNIRGWGLPLGGRKIPLSGNHFMLTGDAASIIDPFTGEGIGNAMLSGMLAAKQVAASDGNFDAASLAAYDKSIYDRLGKELHLSQVMQRLAEYPWLLNLVIGKASRNDSIRDTITMMFENMDIRSRLRKPGFYFDLLFR